MAMIFLKSWAKRKVVEGKIFEPVLIGTLYKIIGKLEAWLMAL